MGYKYIENEEKANMVRRRMIERGDAAIYCSQKRKEFFFTIDHCQSLGDDSGKSDILKDDDWVPVSFGIPMYVKPRESVPDGIVRTKEQYVSVFHYDEREIPNPNPMYQGTFPEMN